MPARLLNRTTLAIAALVAILSAAALLTGACSTTTLPPELSDEQFELIRTTRFDATVGVETSELPIDSDRLLEALRGTGLFKSVTAIDPPPGGATPPADAARPAGAPRPSFDLIARVERPIGRDAVVPIKTALTLGIVPTVVDEKHGFVFSLRSGRTEGDALGIECTYTGKTTLGWLAAILNFLPNHAMKEATLDRRMEEMLALQIATGRESIEALNAAPAR